MGVLGEIVARGQGALTLPRARPRQNRATWDASVAESPARTQAHASQHGMPAGGKELAWLSLGALGVVYGDIGTSPLYAMKRVPVAIPSTHAVRPETAPTQRARRAVAVLLVAHARRRRQVPHVHHARRQQGRGRHPRARGARRSSKIAAAAQPARDPDPARAVRRRPALRRRRDHARRSRCSARSRASSEQSPRFNDLDRADHRRDPDRPVPRAALGTAPHRQGVRLDDAGVVRRDRRRRRCRRSSRHPSVLARGQPALRGRRSSSTTACTASWCSARSSCASPAARRCTPTWATSGARRSASPGTRRVPGAAAQLLRPGRAAPRRAATHGRRTRSTTLVAGAPLLIPMVVLATVAAIIASQALISGAFSLTHQAVQLGYLPRVTVVHTSDKAEGQIYIPEINCAADGRVRRAGARRSTSSTSLAAAYGIAVTGTMAHHVVPVLPRVPPQLGLLVVARRSRCSSRSSSIDLVVLLGERDQDRGRRLVPARGRRRRVHRS